MEEPYQAHIFRWDTETNGGVCPRGKRNVAYDGEILGSPDYVGNYNMLWFTKKANSYIWVYTEEFSQHLGTKNLKKVLAEILLFLSLGY